MSNRVVHFEIHADDIDRASKFYAEVFGWKVERFGNMEYWGIWTAPKESTEPGINGGMLKRPGEKPKEGQCVNSFVCTVQVENIDETIKKIEAAGGTLSMPKFAIAGMAWQAYYQDTEGNVFGIHQADITAQ